MAGLSLKKVATSISEENNISEKNADKILESLSVKELKNLASFLKSENEKSTVEVTSSDSLSYESKQLLEKKFKGMRIQENIDKNMGAGILVKAYDMIYDLSLKGSINQIVQKIEDNL